MRNLPRDFYISLVKVKTMRKIVQIFVALTEKLSFTNKKAALEMILPHFTKTSVNYLFLVPDFSFKTDAIVNQAQKMRFILCITFFGFLFCWFSMGFTKPADGEYFKFMYSNKVTKIRGS